MRILGTVVLALSLIAVSGCLKKELTPEEVALVAELKEQLSETDLAIAAAKAEDEKFAGGLIKALIGVRLEILQTNKALVEQRINAIEAGSPVTQVTNTAQPNPSLEKELLSELEKAKAEAAIAKAEAAVTGGLLGVMKTASAATAEQTVAMLKQGYLAAKYGLVVPAPRVKDVTAQTEGLAASAAIPRADVEACAATQSPSERASCFDALVSRHGIATPDIAAPSKGKWMTSSDKDPLTDNTVSTAIVISESSARGRRDAPALVVRCKDNRTELYINWHDYLGSDAYVTSRVGQEKATFAEWTLSTDKEATFYPGSPVGVLKRIIESESFVANVTPYNESPVTAVFQTTGAVEALADIRQNCGW